MGSNLAVGRVGQGFYAEVRFSNKNKLGGNDVLGVSHTIPANKYLHGALERRRKCEPRRFNNFLGIA